MRQLLLFFESKSLLENIIMDCLAKEPEKRPHNIKELYNRLSSIDFNESWSQDRARQWWEVNLQGYITKESDSSLPVKDIVSKVVE